MIKDKGRPVTLELGVGLPAVKSSLEAESRTAVAPTSWTALVVGFPVAPGLKYDPETRPDRRLGGIWVAEVTREADDAPVAVFLDPDSHDVWHFVDCRMVTVRAYYDHYLPTAYASIAQTCGRLESEDVPAFIRVAEPPRADRDVVPVEPRTASTLAKIFIRGPLFTLDHPSPSQARYRGYPDPIRRATYPIRVDLAQCPGGNTDALPIIGVSWLEVQGYAAWARQRTGGMAWSPARTEAMDRRLVGAAPKAPALEKGRGFPYPADDPRGEGPLGILFATGNLMEFAGLRPDGKVRVVGSDDQAAGSIAAQSIELDRGERPTDVGFRLYAEIPVNPEGRRP
jgi:hypothetical protein